MSETTTTTIIVRTDAADAVRYAVAAGSHPIRLDLSVWPERQRLWLAEHVRDTASGPRLLVRGEQPSLMARTSSELLAWVEQQLLLDDAEAIAREEKERQFAAKLAQQQAESDRLSAERQRAHEALAALPIEILGEESSWTDEIRALCSVLNVHPDSLSVCGHLRREAELDAWRHVMLAELLGRYGASANQLARHAARVLPRDEMDAVFRNALLRPVLDGIGDGICDDYDVTDDMSPLRAGYEMDAAAWDAYATIAAYHCEVPGVQLQALVGYAWSHAPDDPRADAHGQVRKLEVWAQAQWRGYGIRVEAARRFH